jgi:hypothetical protein
MKISMLLISVLLVSSCERQKVVATTNKSSSNHDKELLIIERAYNENLIKEGDSGSEVVSKLGDPDRVRKFEDMTEQWDYYVPVEQLKQGRNISGLSVALRNDKVIGVLPQFTRVE